MNNRYSFEAMTTVYSDGLLWPMHVHIAFKLHSDNPIMLEHLSLRCAVTSVTGIFWPCS